MGTMVGFRLDLIVLRHGQQIVVRHKPTGYAGSGTSAVPHASQYVGWVGSTCACCGNTMLSAPGPGASVCVRGVFALPPMCSQGCAFHLASIG